MRNTLFCKLAALDGCVFVVVAQLHFTRFYAVTILRQNKLLGQDDTEQGGHS